MGESLRYLIVSNPNAFKEYCPSQLVTFRTYYLLSSTGFMFRKSSDYSHFIQDGTVTAVIHMLSCPVLLNEFKHPICRIN